MKENKFIDIGFNMSIMYDENNNFISLIDSDKKDIIKEKYYVKPKRKYVFSGQTTLHGVVMEHKTIPFSSEIDHKNRDRFDNRLCNLRIVDRFTNNLNRCTNKNNTSGFKGVAWHSQHSKWRAFIMLDKKQIHLGLFSSKEEAKIDRLRGEIKYFLGNKEEDKKLLYGLGGEAKHLPHARNYEIVKKEYVEEACKAIKEAFETCVTLVVPLTSDVKFGNDYSEVK